MKERHSLTIDTFGFLAKYNWYVAHGWIVVICFSEVFNGRGIDMVHMVIEK